MTGRSQARLDEGKAPPLGQTCRQPRLVAMENFYQHAEHYFRVMRAASARDD